MIDSISSRTPEGYPHKCHICGARVRVEPSTVPRYDAPCPKCGTLLVFKSPIAIVFSMLKHEITDVIDIVERAHARKGRQRIYLDFANVKTLDSAILGKLISLHRVVQGKRWVMRLCNTPEKIQELFSITKLDKFFGL